MIKKALQTLVLSLSIVLIELNLILKVHLSIEKYLCKVYVHFLAEG